MANVLIFVIVSVLCVCAYRYLDGFVSMLVVAIAAAWLNWGTLAAIPALLLAAYAAIKLVADNLAQLEYNRYMAREAKVAFHFAEAFASQNLQSLQLRKQRLNNANSGTASTDWDCELQRIITAMIYKDRQGKDLHLVLFEKEMKAAIEQVLARAQFSPSSDVDAVQDQVEYVEYCSGELRKLGWVISPLGSRDPADPTAFVIAASIDGMTMLLKCLSCSTPVSETVVRDMINLKWQQGVNTSGVVTNSTYTEAACKLARRSGTVLFHQTELSTFDSLRYEGFGPVPSGQPGMRDPRGVNAENRQ